MFGKHIIYLRTDTPTLSDIGDVTTTKAYKKVYATRKSIVRSEFYQAKSTNLKPEIAFVIWYKDYNAEQSLKYEDAEYNIIRSYQLGDDAIEIVCEKVI